MTGEPRPFDLDRLFTPRSIAIFGASETEMSFGWRILTSLRTLGYPGEILPVNPRRDRVLGLDCLPDIASLPEGVDAIAFCVNRDLVMAHVGEAARKGIGAAAIYDTGFGEAGEDGRARERELVRVAREHGMAVVGPNCMGSLSPATSSTLYSGLIERAEGLAGNVALVTQSGAIAVGLLTDIRRYGFSHVVSSGNEAVVGVERYLDWLASDDATRVIALFLESVRDVGGFTRALDRAAEAGKPIVVLKVGRSVRAQHAIRGHTGAIAGDGRAFSALLARHGAIEVHEIDEMVELLAACQATRLPRGPRLGVVSASGGQVEMIHDIAERQGLELPRLGAATLSRLGEADLGHGDANPLDAWGNGDWQRNLPLALRVMGADPDIDAVVFTSDTADGQPTRPTAYGPLLLDATAEIDKPYYFYNTRPGHFRVENAALMRGTPAAVIGGGRQGLGAIDRLGRWSRRRLDGPRAPVEEGLSEVPSLAPFRDGRASVNESDAKRLLERAGLPVVRERALSDATGLRDATEAIGFPAVLKVVSDEIPHRSEHGLVRTGLRTIEALEAALTEMSATLARLAPRAAFYVLQEEVPAGVEMFVGLAVDPELGPCLLAGPGGALVELWADTAVRPLPLRAGDAAAMIEETRLGRLLDGFRGSPPADRAAATACIEALGALGHGWGDGLREADFNPVIVLAEGQGCRLVDAVIFPEPSLEGRQMCGQGATRLIVSTSSPARGRGPRRRRNTALGEHRT